MSTSEWRLPIGASPISGGVRFRVWAPAAERVEVVVYGPSAETLHALEPEAGGYFSGEAPDLGAGVRYRYRLDGRQAFPTRLRAGSPKGSTAPPPWSIPPLSRGATPAGPASRWRR